MSGQLVSDERMQIETVGCHETVEVHSSNGRLIRVTCRKCQVSSTNREGLAAVEICNAAPVASAPVASSGRRPGWAF
ncbi:MAG: hypothetical protein A3B95_02370 [Candidatus Doudnabacteria bacterium RIFCSPHIGHO2_02_FULL_43_13b]|nr:MAG: hypothetical protein A3B95_02370 [Candidatus Doudnabacteria bacterium RIFCSPHIGHO2_02_FULL_43_13b]